MKYKISLWCFYSVYFSGLHTICLYQVVDLLMVSTLKKLKIRVLTPMACTRNDVDKIVSTKLAQFLTREKWEGGKEAPETWSKIDFSLSFPARASKLRFSWCFFWCPNFDMTCLGIHIFKIKSNVIGWWLIPIFSKWHKTFIVSHCVWVQMIQIKLGMIGRLTDLILSKWIGAFLYPQQVDLHMETKCMYFDPLSSAYQIKIW